MITTDDEITEYLANIRKLINQDTNNLKIATNREVNLNFIAKYNLKKKNIIQIIRRLRNEHFQQKVVNEHEKYSKEYLYIFGIKVELTDSIGNNNSVLLYIKFNVLNEKVILVSFHEAKYKFKEKKEYGKEIL